MSEDELVRSIRRGLSQQLTRTINDSSQFPEVRITVLYSLATLWGRLESLKAALRAELRLHESQPLFYFYLKGGNAYACVIDPTSAAAITQGGGDSDWDSQVVVDPWAPLPIQDMIYAAIEDLVRDELRNCSVQIASWAPALKSPDELLFQGPRLLYRYEVVVDNPQTIRQILDRDQVGLWVDTRRKISDQETKGELPGLLFNDAIKPFQLIRLGYTWHATPQSWPAPLLPGQAKGPAIDRPLLMELADVTLPRRNTVEAVEMWERLLTEQMKVESTEVSILQQGVTITELLPLPSLAYHFTEQALMLCEVAAGVSNSVDKVDRRFRRLQAIYTAAAVEPDLQVHYQRHLAAMAGVPLAQITDRTLHSGQLDAVLTANGAGNVLQAAPGTVDYMALNMMYHVSCRQLTYDGERILQTNPVLNLLVNRINQQYRLAEIGFTDDLALYATVVNNGYLTTDNFPATGLDLSVLLRLSDASQLEDAAFELEKQLPLWFHDWVTRAATPLPAAQDEWLLQTFWGKAIRVVRRGHVTFRQVGMSKEQTLVMFADEQAAACISLTTAAASEAPFLPDPLVPGRRTASVVDLAEQRKVAAAVIEDFCIRNALAKQQSMLQRLFVQV